MLRFISTLGPDTPGPPDFDVRLWGSAADWSGALALKAKVDPIAPAGTRVYLAHSLVRKDLRTRAQVFPATPQAQSDLPYLATYIVDPTKPDARTFDVDIYQRIGFDVFSAPPAVTPNEWHRVCEEATKIFQNSSSGPPGGQV